MARPGISTVGAIFSYGVEVTAGTKPETFTKLTRINAIGGISTTRESIDASALEDALTKRIAGRGDVDEELPITVNLTDETITEWETLITAYTTAKAAGKGVWFQTKLPDLTKSFFVIAEPPTSIPQPELDQNSLVTVEMGLTVNDYKGLDTTVVPA